MKISEPWWHQTTIYQIYPRSFQDTNGDGVGDIPGILQRLGYLQELGVETLWISPFFVSPGKDHGYDIADYTAIDPAQGSLSDVEALIHEVHKRKMKILFDLVLNHTSEEHPWFQESRSTKENPKRNYYYWRKKPNNWYSMVGKPGWNLDPRTQEYYYSNFLSFQPDLNYRNPEVKKVMFGVAEFWLKKGVDGFRLDIFNSILKDPEFRNNPFAFRYFPSPDNNDEAFFQNKIHNMNHPDNFQLAKELRSICEKSKKDTLLLGEVSGKDEVIISYLGDGKDALSMVFQFGWLDFEWSCKWFRKKIEHYETIYAYPYLPTVVFGNHDQKRIMHKVGGDEAKMKVLFLLQLTLRALPVLYQGEEIGMRGGDFSPDQATDPLSQGLGWAPKWLLNALGVFVTRDDARTPMQWDTSPHAGFTNANPWLPIGGDWETANVDAQEKDPQSLLQFYKKLLHFRSTSAILKEGTLENLKESEDLLQFDRVFLEGKKKKALRILLNFSPKSKSIEISGKVVLATHPSLQNKPTPLDLPGISGIVVEFH